jgi:hypothetical protein
MKKKKKKQIEPEVQLPPPPPVKLATEIKWDSLPNEERAYNNITVFFKDGEEVRAASADISLRNNKILNVKMGNPQKDFSCQHKLPPATIKRLKERNQKIIDDFQKKQDKQLEWKLKNWPTVVRMTWNKKMSRFTFMLKDGKELKVTPGLGLNGIGAGAFAIGKPYQGHPAVLYIRDQPHWDGMSKKLWDFYRMRNVVIAAKQYREKMKEARLRAVLEAGPPKPKVVIDSETPYSKERKTLFGHNISSVLRRMGKEGFDFPTAKRALEAFGLRIKDKTIRGQLWCGTQKAGKYGDCANLTEDQIDNLYISAAKGQKH